jgi:hypothetical protein
MYPHPAQQGRKDRREEGKEGEISMHVKIRMFLPVAPNTAMTFLVAMLLDKEKVDGVAQLSSEQTQLKCNFSHFA